MEEPKESIPLGWDGVALTGGAQAALQSRYSRGCFEVGRPGERRGSRFMRLL